jgi:hypothetical protein
MDKRYQVFVSSTYADLRDERRAIIQTLIEMDCIPAGMELFPASDDEQFEFIKRVINECDYYLLVVAGRYGSVDAAGVSYTEKEFDYAVSRGIAVVALIHDNPKNIVLGKSEEEPKQREKLERFKEKVSTGRLVKHWREPSELAGLVAISLQHTIKTHPAVGWIRADTAASVDVLNDVNRLRKENENLRSVLSRLKAPPALPDLAGLDEEVDLPYRYRSGSFSRDEKVRTTWRRIFSCIAPYVARNSNEHDVKGHLADALIGKDRGDIEDQFFQTVGIQLRALGLIRITYSSPPEGISASFFSGSLGVWSLTPKGEGLMIDVRAVRSSKAKS